MLAFRTVALTLLLFAPAVARADFAFTVTQDVSSLYGATSPPGPFYLGFTVNSGDNGLYNNHAAMYGFGVSSGVTLVGSPIVVQGNAVGDLATPFSVLELSEGVTSLPGDYTQVLQEFAVTSPTANVTFTVAITQSFVGPAMSFSPDTFTYQLLYDDDGNPLTAPVPVVTDLVPGNVDFVYYENKEFNTDILTGGPNPGSNISPLDALGAASIIPEPGGLAVWGLALGSVGAFQWRRRRLAAAA